MLRKTFFISSVALLFLTIPHPALADVSAELEQAKSNIISLIQQRNYAEAQEQTQRLLTDFSKHKDIAKAIWQIAGKYDELKEYDKAYELNQYNVEHFRNDVHAVLSQVEIVKYHFRKEDEPAVDAAVSNFLTAFSGQPTLPKGIYHIARRYDEFKRYDKAIKLHQYNVDHFPDDIHALWSQMEIIYSRLRDGNEPAAGAAVGNLLTVFSKQPTLPKEIWQTGQKYIELKKYDKAFEINQYNIKHFPNDMYAMWSQVEIIYSYIRDGNDTAADEAFKKLLTAFSSQPTLPKEVWQIGQRYIGLKKYDKAFEINQYNVEHFPSDMYAMWSQVEIVYSYIRDANEPAADAAYDKLRTVFSGQPTLPKEISQIADAYNSAGRYDKANQLYQKSGQLYQSVIDGNADSNDELWAKVGIAKLAISVGDDNAVRVDVNNLITDFNGQPALPSAIFAIGEEYYNKTLNTKGEPNLSEAKAKEYYQKALTVWERIITELPKSESIFTTHAYYFSAICHHELGEHEKAIEYFQKVLSDRPGYQYAWSAQYLIGECYEDLQRSGILPASEANPLMEQAYKAVIEKYPDCSLVGSACLKLGRPSFKKGQWADAAYYFEIFLQKNPDDPRWSSVLYNLGQAYEKMGKLELAAELYRVFIQTASPIDTRIKTVQALLEKLEGENK
jgi:tetratricopeptide (TPR) repeat protein